LGSEQPSHQSPIAHKALGEVDRLAPELIRFTKELVRKRSVTGDEEGAQGIIRDKLSSMGGTIDYWKPDPSDFKGYEAFVAEEKGFAHRPNLVARFRGNDSKRTLAFNGHVDVVPEGDHRSWRYPPFSGRTVQGKLFGRGSCDMKAGLAAAIFAVEAIQRAGARMKNDVLLESVIGEESGGVGTLATILRGHIPDAAIIAEPTNLELVIAQAGCLMFRIVIRGKAAHGASRYLGVSAVEKFQPVLTALQRLEDRRKSLKKLPLYSSYPNAVPLSIGTVRAGNWDSTVPESLVAEGRYGVWPGESLATARSMFEGAVATSASKDDWLRSNPPQIAWFGPQWESASLPPSHGLVKLMQGAVWGAIGRLPRLSGITGGTDMRLFTKVAKVPALLFGPGDDSVAHFSDEYVVVKDVLSACKAYAAASLAWDGQPGD
jgi:acetylornithine deacetylase